VETWHRLVVVSAVILGAAILAKLVLDEGWNFFIAFALVAVIGGALVVIAATVGFPAGD
jgi:hypothetical protein